MTVSSIYKVQEKNPLLCIMSLILILTALLLTLIVLKPSVITEALTAMGITHLPGWSALDLHGYTNTCLTKKPYGFPSHSNMYRYWRDRPKSWAVEYSEERVRGDINNVRSNQEPSSILAGSQPAPAAAGGPSLNYYHNPDGYCLQYPDEYPCPNYWRGGPHIRTHISGDMSKPVPGLLAGNFGHVLDKDINDNYHIRVVEKGREDHGLCGNN